MVIRVSVIGYDLIGKRVADAVARQHDMVLHGVFEEDPGRQAMVVRKGLGLLSGCPGCQDVGGDVAVICRDDGCVHDVPVIHAAHLRSSSGVLFSSCLRPDALFRQPHVRIALPDVIAWNRVFQAITPITCVERLFANIIVRAGHATQRSAGSVDALEPLPEDTLITQQAIEAFGQMVPYIEVRRVRASYTRSHLHTVKLDLDKPIDRQDVLEALADSSRILLGTASDGFATTADIQELSRNSMRSRGDRPEVFIWEESLIVNGQQLFLMMDVCQEATSILETIDAIRLQQMRVTETIDAIRQTDVSLDVGHLWQSTRDGHVAGSDS